MARPLQQLALLLVEARLRWKPEASVEPILEAGPWAAAAEHLEPEWGMAAALARCERALNPVQVAGSALALAPRTAEAGRRVVC